MTKTEADRPLPFFRKETELTSLSYYDSPLGRLLIMAEDEAISGLWFVGQKYFPAELCGAEAVNPEAAGHLHHWLDEYFSGRAPDISRLILSPSGSSFRKAVWDMLCRIPYGCTASYGQLARELERQMGKKVSAQAVGGAVGHNPISIIIPCHRVVGADGSLTGYAGGLEKKAALLALEKYGT